MLRCNLLYLPIRAYARVGGGSEPHDLRTEPDPPVVGVMSMVAEGDADSHGVSDCLDVQ